MRKLAICLVFITGCQESSTSMLGRLDKLDANAQASFDSYEMAEKLSVVYEVVGDNTNAAVAHEQAVKHKVEFETAEKAYEALKGKLSRRVDRDKSIPRFPGQGKSTFEQR